MRNWRDLSYSRRAAIIGFVVGVIFAAYSINAPCHLFLDSHKQCGNILQGTMASIEYVLWVIPYSIIGLFDKASHLAGGALLYIGFWNRIALIASPIIVCTLIGLIIGFSINFFKLRIDKKKK